MIRFFILIIFVTLAFVDIFAINFIHPVDAKDYDTLRQLAEGNFCKPKNGM